MMELKTEAQIQKVISLEVALIIAGIGVDLLIESLLMRDWIVAAIILVGFGIVGGLYWHTRYLDRWFNDVRAGLHSILALPQSHHAVATTVAHDVSAASIADRPVIRVSNFPLSRNFYATVLAPLGYSLTMEFPALSMAAFGIGGASDLWIKGDGVEQRIRAAFSATSKAAVDEFCARALLIDAVIIETAGTRPDRGTGYYAAAITDPDGYTIEAVFHDPSAMN